MRRTNARRTTPPTRILAAIAVCGATLGSCGNPSPSSPSASAPTPKPLSPSHLDEWWAWYAPRSGDGSPLSQFPDSDRRAVELWLADQPGEVIKLPTSSTELGSLVRDLARRRHLGGHVEGPWSEAPPARFSPAARAAWYNNRGFRRFASWRASRHIGTPNSQYLADALEDFSQAAILGEGMGRLNLASLYTYQLDVANAQRELDMWSAAFKRTAPVESLRAHAAIEAELFMLRNDLPSATECLQRAVELSGGLDHWNLGRLGGVLVAVGRAEEGLQLLERADAAFAEALSQLSQSAPAERVTSLRYQRGLLRLHLGRAVRETAGGPAAASLLREGAEPAEWFGMLALLMAGDRDPTLALRSISDEMPPDVRIELVNQWLFAVQFGEFSRTVGSGSHPGIEDQAVGEEPMTAAVLRAASAPRGLQR